ncbi:olfactory receptor 7A42-like [Ambystoma mexicanum]|uniref:olfactory receptor 7A42-like n=1 Tax=Ambystoma mexicanum TaxID=8296 RepID=UPI0037E7490A
MQESGKDPKKRSASADNDTNGIILWGFIYAKEERYMIISFLVPFFLAGMLGNMAIIFTICAKRSLRVPKNVLICELCAVDLAGLVSSCTYFFTMFSQDIVGTVTFRFCLIQYFFLIAHSGFQVFTVSIMAFDRYYVICHPFQYTRKFTNQLVLRLLCFSWTFSLMYPLVYVLSFSGQQLCYLVNSCSFLCTASSLESSICLGTTFPLLIKGYRVSMMAAHLGVSVSLVGFSYYKIFKVSRSTHLSMPSKRALQTVVTHALVLSVFYSTAGLLVITGSMPLKDATEESSLAILRACVDLVYFTVPSTFNPIIYGLRSDDLRKELVKYLVRVLKCQRSRAGLDRKSFRAQVGAIFDPAAPQPNYIKRLQEELIRVKPSH